MKLHLGCGRRFIPGFVHVDLDDFPHIDHRHAIDRLPMFADGSAELIYCCHAFEYFDRQEAPAVLAEWRRVLRPGGVLRLAVPDFEALVTLYQRTSDLDRLLGPLYGRIVVRTSAGEARFYHRTAYDFASLARVCREAGLVEARRYDWQATEHAAVDDFSRAYYPHMDEANGLLISLNVEVTKGVG